MSREKSATEALLVNLFHLLPPGLRQFVKFGIVGVVGFLVDAGMLKFNMELLGLDHYSGRVISFIVAATTTWFCNRIFTFRGQGQGALHRQWMKFLVVSSGGFVFNYGAYAFLVATQPIVATYPTLGVAAGSLAGMFFNFFASKRLVFR